MEVINIKSNKGILTVKWSDIENLSVYSGSQAGCYGSTVDLDNPKLLHQRHFEKFGSSHHITPNINNTRAYKMLLAYFALKTH